jgi:hypothetical protein
MSDIMFDGDRVVIEGHWIKVQGWDIMLDSADRRILDTGERRAIVHGPGDKLIINYNDDYPNGVQINGKLIVDTIYVKGKAGFSAGITTPQITAGHPTQPQDVTPGGIPSGGAEWGLDLVGCINSLQSTIAELKDRVSKLEAAHP